MLVIKMAKVINQKISNEKMFKVVELVTEKCHEVLNFPINFNFDAQVVGQCDVVLNVVELSFIKEELPKNLSTMDVIVYLNREMAKIGLHNHSNVKEVWLSNQIKCKVNYI